MNENNAAQPGELLLDYAMHIAHERELDVTGHKHDSDGAVRRFKAAVDRALRSKLRAEGVQAGDVRAMLASFGSADCREGSRAVGHSGPENGEWEDYIEVPTKTLDRIRAALASAPVAGEAQKPVAYAVHGIDARGKIRVAAVKPWAGDESLCDSDGLGDMWSGNEPLVYGNAAPQASEAVPEGDALVPVKETEAMHDAVMELLYVGVPRTRTQTLLDAYIRAALKTQTDKYGGDCAKGAGGGQQKYWLCCGSKDPNHPNRRAPDCFNADRAKWGTADQHSVVKQSLTSTQTGEKGESDV